jgi:hypothetical protein
MLTSNMYKICDTSSLFIIEKKNAYHTTYRYENTLYKDRKKKIHDLI